MDYPDIFDDGCQDSTKRQTDRESFRTKLVAGLLELNAARKSCTAKQKELNDGEAEISRLRVSNKELKVRLINSLIAKDEIESKKLTLTADIERIRREIKEFEREADIMLSGDDVAQICERFSTENQLNLLNKIKDARCKLMSLGIPHHCCK